VQSLDHLGIDGEDLLVNGNGRNIEILLGVEIGDLEVHLDRLFRLTLLQVKVTHLQVETLVFWAGLDELEIFLDRFLRLTLQDVLLGIPEYLLLVDGKRLLLYRSLGQLKNYLMDSKKSSAKKLSLLTPRSHGGAS
jgi:hypothetical protein